MNLVLVKQSGVIALAAINATLIAWALITHRKRGSLPDGYYKLLPASTGIAAIQVLTGLYFLLEGRQVHLMHIFYGTLVAIGAILQYQVRKGTAAGHKYRNKPLIHAAVALFVALLAARSWMSG
ncbi:MAG: hypothetical protein ACOY94_07925 [Bacillota bacterium]